MKTAGPPLPVRSASGCFLQLEDGRRIIDCISSWWVTLHGHGNRRIADAIHEQAKNLEHVIFAGFTHEPAITLSERLLAHLPSHFTRVFFSDNGSTSVEVALKMALQYWQNIGQTKRTKFIGFEHGYHGDTVGAMSAGGTSGFWAPFRSIMFEIETIPFPSTFDNDSNVSQKEQESLSALRQLLETKQQEYAAIIIEPLVQGAAGMRMCSTAYLRKLQMLANEFDVLLIFDEVMTGFGRTGDWFACTKAAVEPDIICLSKGITGGFLPLSVTVASENIYQAFYADELEKALFHSHSYTGNPIACAAANASMELLEECESIFKTFEARHRKFAHDHLGDLTGNAIHSLRYCGTIMAFDINTDAASQSYFGALAPKLRKEFIEQGLLLRPLGNTIYLMPPLCTEDTDLDEIYGTIRKVLGVHFAELNTYSTAIGSCERRHDSTSLAEPASETDTATASR